MTRATSAPGTYLFTPLIQAPQIQALSQSPDFAPHLQVLEIFSHDTYSAYVSDSNLPPLSDAQLLKLRQLSVLALAKDPANLSYGNLTRALGLDDTKDLETLVISAVYAGLLDATLDPYHQTVHISRLSPLRDLAPNSIPTLISALRTWSSRCDSTLSDLESQIALVRSEALRRHREKTAWETQQAKLLENEKDGANDNRNRGPVAGNLVNRAVSALERRYGKRGSGSMEDTADDDEAMDVDDEEYDDAAEGSAGVGGKKKSSRRKL